MDGGDTFGTRSIPFYFSRHDARFLSAPPQEASAAAHRKNVATQAPFKIVKSVVITKGDSPLNSHPQAKVYSC